MVLIDENFQVYDQSVERRLLPVSLLPHATRFDACTISLLTEIKWVSNHDTDRIWFSHINGSANK